MQYKKTEFCLNRDWQKVLEKIVGKKNYCFKILTLFYDDRHYFNSITGFAKVLNVTAITIRPVIRDLVSIGVLTELDIGRSVVLKIANDNPYTQAAFAFISSVRCLSKSDCVRSGVERGK